MRGLVRILFFLVIVLAALSLLRGLLNNLLSARTKPGRLVKDPVCGMYVSEQTAIRGNGHFFCSEECRGKYLS